MFVDFGRKVFYWHRLMDVCIYAMAVCELAIKSERLLWAHKIIGKTDW